jgi:prophage antirepressor-like protein
VLFVGKDVAKRLGYKNPAKALRDHVDTEDKLTERIVLSGQRREVIFINESGLYSLILSSKSCRRQRRSSGMINRTDPLIRFGEIRTLTNERGEPLFIGKDVATALGYRNPSNALQVHVDDEDKTSYLIQVPGSNYKAKTIRFSDPVIM